MQSNKSFKSSTILTQHGMKKVDSKGKKVLGHAPKILEVLEKNTANVGSTTVESTRNPTNASETTPNPTSSLVISPENVHNFSEQEMLKINQEMLKLKTVCSLIQNHFLKLLELEKKFKDYTRIDLQQTPNLSSDSGPITPPSTEVSEPANVTFQSIERSSNKKVVKQIYDDVVKDKKNKESSKEADTIQLDVVNNNNSIRKRTEPTTTSARHRSKRKLYKSCYLPY